MLWWMLPFLLLVSGASSGMIAAHWYEPSNPPGLEVFTHETLPWMADDAIGLRYTGPLRAPLAAQLRRILLTPGQTYRHVLLELDSDGGDLSLVHEVAMVLGEVSRRMELTTRVTEGSICASGCIPLFMQGQTRKASGASIWVFHGARGAMTSLPDPAATENYLNLLSAAGMKPGFRTMLEQENRIYRPGSLTLSGYELFAVYDGGIITDLLPAWREQSPSTPTGLGPR